MSALAVGSKSAAAALLLVLGACSRPPAANNSAATPGPIGAPVEDMNRTAPDVYGGDEPAPTRAAPRETGGPRNAFIVCPGNPRCPPAGGTRPRAVPPD